MKKVMLLGDSIRLSYKDDVAKRLAGKTEVMGPEENCRFRPSPSFSCRDGCLMMIMM